MTPLNFDCDTKQGYMFSKAMNQTVGFITALTLAGVELRADLTTIKDPLNPDAVLGGGAVAVLSVASWDTTPTSPLSLSGQFSAANLQVIRACLAKRATDFSVKLRFAVYKYDQVAKKMYKVFHSGNAELEASIWKNGNEVFLKVSDSASAYPTQPKSFAFSIEVAPPRVPGQSLQVASGATKTTAMPWHG